MRAYAPPHLCAVAPPHLCAAAPPPPPAFSSPPRPAFALPLSFVSSPRLLAFSSLLLPSVSWLPPPSSCLPPAPSACVLPLLVVPLHPMVCWRRWAVVKRLHIVGSHSSHLECHEVGLRWRQGSHHWALSAGCLDQRLWVACFLRESLRWVHAR